MCKKFHENRNAFRKLIFEKREFQSSELLRDFAEARGRNVLIDGSQTTRDYIDELADLGILEDLGSDKYRVIAREAVS